MTLGKIGGIGKSIGQGFIKAGEDSAKTVPKQIIGEEAEIRQRENGSQEQNGQSQALRKSQTEEITNALYGKSDSKNSGVNGTNHEKIDGEIAQKNPDKSPEEIQKMISLRMQLHKESYYDPTFNPVKQEAEEKPAEKVEREKKEERWELEEKEKKKPSPLAVKNERNRIESRAGSG